MKSILHARLFTLNIGSFVFSPGIVPSIVTVVLLYIMLSLGQWQAGKAEYKRNLQQKIEERKNLQPVGINEIPHEMDERLFLPVIIDGAYDVEHNFLHDNRIINGQAGYDIYTPFRMANGDTILVNRGWVVQGRTRDELPLVETPVDTIGFKGLLDKPPSKGVVLADNLHSGQDWPMVLQYVDVTELEQLLGYQLMPVILRLDPNAEHGFHRELPALKLDSAKNTGYAFQWYALSAALFGIYMAVNVKRRTD